MSCPACQQSFIIYSESGTFVLVSFLSVLAILYRTQISQVPQDDIAPSLVRYTFLSTFFK